MSMSPSDLNRFMSKIECNENGCWVWTGCTMPNGYTQFRWNEKTHLTHRVAYMHFHGPIPDGMDVMHLCHNRACVNPDHLRAGTRSENLRMRTLEAAGRGGRVNKGKKKHPGFGRKQSIAQRTSRMRCCPRCGIEMNAASMAQHQRRYGHDVAR